MCCRAAGVKITLNRYSHAIPGPQTEAAEKTDAVLRGLLLPRLGDEGERE